MSKIYETPACGFIAAGAGDTVRGPRPQTEQEKPLCAPHTCSHRLLAGLPSLQASLQGETWIKHRYRVPCPAPSPLRHTHTRHSIVHKGQASVSGHTDTPGPPAPGELTIWPLEGRHPDPCYHTGGPPGHQAR